MVAGMNRPCFAAFLEELKRTPAEPLPPCGEEWPALVERISRPGRAAEVTEEAFDHWLEVLPPHWMGAGGFCFAEGMEPFRLFWSQRGRYFVRQLSWEETLCFCKLAGIRPPM
jgi:hypothetical protein